MKLPIIHDIVIGCVKMLALPTAGCLRAPVFAMLSGEPNPETSRYVLPWQVYLDAFQQTNKHVRNWALSSKWMSDHAPGQINIVVS